VTQTNDKDNESMYHIQSNIQAIHISCTMQDEASRCFIEMFLDVLGYRVDCGQYHWVAPVKHKTRASCAMLVRLGGEQTWCVSALLSPAPDV